MFQNHDIKEVSHTFIRILLEYDEYPHNVPKIYTNKGVVIHYTRGGCITREGSRVTKNTGRVLARPHGSESK